MSRIVADFSRQDGNSQEESYTGRVELFFLICCGILKQQEKYFAFPAIS